MGCPIIQEMRCDILATTLVVALSGCNAQSSEPASPRSAGPESAPPDAMAKAQPDLASAAPADAGPAVVRPIGEQPGGPEPYTCASQSAVIYRVTSAPIGEGIDGETSVQVVHADGNWCTGKSNEDLRPFASADDIRVGVLTKTALEAVHNALSVTEWDAGTTPEVCAAVTTTRTIVEAPVLGKSVAFTGPCGDAAHGSVTRLTSFVVSTTTQGCVDKRKPIYSERRNREKAFTSFAIAIWPGGMWERGDGMFHRVFGCFNQEQQRELERTLKRARITLRPAPPQCRSVGPGKMFVEIKARKRSVEYFGNCNRKVPSESLQQLMEFVHAETSIERPPH